MRAQNQQDLIYKRGQAGITKASVTIVFDNSDRDKSPVGLENCKQITVTRQISLPNNSKYLLNGHKSQQHTIQTLFQGVQLNINNPNFLIMQGRITKVLNMRPQEILGMVEEAAGTRMFEERKDKAKKTMDKKEKRVDEINALLAEEIIPKLDTLRAEKRAFLQWQKACSELERIGRLLRAWEWTEGKERVARKEADITKREKEQEKLKRDMDRFHKECTAAEDDVKEVNAKREAEMRKGGKFKQKEEEVAELEKQLVKMKTQSDIKKASISEEEKKVESLVAESAQVCFSLLFVLSNTDILQSAQRIASREKSKGRGTDEVARCCQGSTCRNTNCLDQQRGAAPEPPDRAVLIKFIWWWLYGSTCRRANTALHREDCRRAKPKQTSACAEGVEGSRKAMEGGREGSRRRQEEAR